MEQTPHPNIKEVTLVVLGTFLFYILLSLLVSEPLGLYGIVFLELMLIGPTLIYIAFRRLPIRKTLRLNPVSHSVLFYSAVIALGSTAVVDEINRLVQTVLPMPEELLRQMQELVTWDSMHEAILLFLGAVLFAAFSEELLFRGLYQTTLERTFDVTKAVILTALLFTIAHMQPWVFIELTLIGTLLGVVAWRSNSVVPAMLFHGMNNALSLIMTNTDPRLLTWYEWRGHVAPWWVVTGLLMIYFGFKGLYRVTEIEPLKQ